MTRIYVAGVNHFDPFHRASTGTWLDQIAGHEATAPAFIANEWTDTAYEFARDHREEFRVRVAHDYTMLDPDSLQTVAHSFAYEGDVFDQAFGHDGVLWLGHPTKVETLVQFRVDRCHQYVDYQGDPKDGPDFLRMLSVGAHFHGQQPGPGDERDGELAAAIHVKSLETEAEWAVAILGANHAYRFDATVVDLLDSDHDCRVRIMLANANYVDL